MKQCKKCGACCVAIPIAQTKKELLSKGDGAFIRKHWKRISRREGCGKRKAYWKTKLGKEFTTFRIFIKSLKGRRLYSCDWFDEKIGRCKHYKRRPYVCRDFPYYGRPPNSNVNRILPGSFCSYWTKEKK